MSDQTFTPKNKTGRKLPDIDPKVEQMAMGRKSGRPTKLTLAIIEKLADALRAGNFIEAACEYAGISSETFRQWSAIANSDDATPMHLEFKDAVGKARATAEIRNVAFIQRAAQSPQHWTAAAWWLERSYPSRWGKRTMLTQEISGPNGGPIRVDNPREYLLSILSEIPDREDIEEDGTESATDT